MNYQELNLADAVVRPRHQEAVRHLEELEVRYAELKQGVSHGAPDKRPRT